MKGYLQVYTGDGKGKTTAALGLAVRAAGAGLKVFIGQFVKGTPSAETTALQKLNDQITLRRYGRSAFIINQPTAEDISAAQAGLTEVRQIIQSGSYDLVILDEANIAVHYALFSIDELIETISNRPAHVEIVITGRNAHSRLIATADLVTEMIAVKHYFQQGVIARLGIEK